MKNKKLKSYKSIKKYAFIIPIGLIAIGAMAYLLLSRESNEVNVEARTTSEISSAQQDFNIGPEGDGDKDPGATTEDQGTANVTDTGGVASSNTNNPRNSNSGEITLYLPIDNTLIKSGQEIAGISTLSTIHYRLIDSDSGVIANGTLSVVSGRFSGQLTFVTKAKEGRLDIFATRSDASEYSVIEVPLRFSI